VLVEGPELPHVREVARLHRDFRRAARLGHADLAGRVDERERDLLAGEGLALDPVEGDDRQRRQRAPPRRRRR
jgi:hypothetical protein